MRKNGPSPSKPGFIQEIEGIRGVALTLVVLFHLFGNGRVSGGVDVFLVISAFLLTGSLLRRLENRQQTHRAKSSALLDRPLTRTARALDLGPHFAKVAARLIPTAAVVLVGVGIMTFLIAPAAQIKQILSEIFATALYFENWELINSQLSYSAAGPRASPLQHFWSLSMQGQFFLFWPLLFLLVGALALVIGFRVRRALLALTLGLTVVSMLYAFNLTLIDQPVAYFDTYARFWELGIGAAIAFIPTSLHLARWLREIFIWLGLILILTCGFVINGGVEFPGPLTLWPVGAIALILIGSSNMPTRSSASRILALQPFPFLARISYPFYLWHWPILVFYLLARHRDTVGWRGATLVLVVSTIIAWATERWVAMPYASWNLRVPRFRRIAPSLAAVIVIGVIASIAISVSVKQDQIALARAAVSSPDYPGALALTDPAYSDFSTDTAIRPAPGVAAADLPDLYQRGCMQNWRNIPSSDTVLICKDARRHPKKTIVMSGGSHVVQWYPALREIAAQQQWALIVVDKGACRLTTGDAGDGLSQSCGRWNKSAISVIDKLKPDAVITVSSKTPARKGQAEVMYAGQVKAWQELAAAGVPVVAIRDTPRLLMRVPECLSETQEVNECGRSRNLAFAKRMPAANDAYPPKGTVLLDLTNGICNHSTCKPVVGNVVVYRDDNHLTATYSRSLAPFLEEKLRAQAPWLF